MTYWLWVIGISSVIFLVNWLILEPWMTGSYFFWERKSDEVVEEYIYETQ